MESIQRRGPWSAERVAAHLDEARIPLRLAVQSGSGPSVVSLWYLHDAGSLWCATPAAAAVVGWLGRDPRCGFEVAPDAPPYRGVRGRGRASLHPESGVDVLRALVNRYLDGEDTRLARWLLSREEPEVAIRIAPESLSSWDFTERMRGG